MPDAAHGGIVKIDLHTHTSHGSACAYMDPDQLVRRAQAVGLDGVCITEHDHVWDEGSIARLRERHRFLVIGGAEVSTDHGHVLVFGLHRPVRDVYRLEDLRALADEAGAILVMAHPFRYEPALLEDFASSSDHEELLRRISVSLPVHLLEAIEVCNGRSGLREQALSSLLAEEVSLQGTGGSDAHAALEVGSCYSVFPGRISSEAELLAQLKSGSCRAVDPRWQMPTSSLSTPYA